MPIVRVLGDGLSGDRVIAVDAILNGTSNAVLSRMESDGCRWTRRSPTPARNGYAEVDPSLDLDGSRCGRASSRSCARWRFVCACSPTRSRRGRPRASAQDASEAGAAARRHDPADRARRRTTGSGPRSPPGSRRSSCRTSSLFARMTGPQNAAVITCAYAGDITLTGTGRRRRCAGRRHHRRPA